MKALFDETTIFYINQDTDTIFRINKDKTNYAEIIQDEVLDFCISNDFIFYVTKKQENYIIMRTDKYGLNACVITQGYSVNEYNNKLYVVKDKIYCMDYDGRNSELVIDEQFDLDNCTFFIQDNIIIYQTMDQTIYKQDLDGNNKFMFDYGNLMGAHDNWIYFVKIIPTKTIEIAQFGRVKNDGSVVQLLDDELNASICGNVLFTKVFNEQWWVYFQWVDGMYYFPVIDLEGANYYFGLQEKEKLQNTVILEINNNFALVNGDVSKIDKMNTSIVPFVQDGRTYLPIRFISEALGADVLWDADTNTVNIAIDSKDISLTIGIKTILVNGNTKEIDVAPMIVNGRTFLPIRALIEEIGMDINWDADRELIIITPPNLFDDLVDIAEMYRILSCFNINEYEI